MRDIICDVSNNFVEAATVQCTW